MIIFSAYGNHAALRAGVNYSPEVVFTKTLNLNNTGNENYSHRVVIPVTLTNAATQVRIKASSASSGAWSVDNFAIGRLDTGYATLASPVELLVSGASGFALSAAQTVQSDWATLSIPSGSSSLVFIFDHAATNGNFGWSNTSTTGINAYEKSATNSYNVAAPTGFSTFANVCFCVAEIEVR